MRIETDFLGKIEIPDNAFYGIHSLRAKENFLNDSNFPIEWYKAVGITKKAFYETYLQFKKSVKTKFPNKNIPLKWIENSVIEVLIETSQEISEGKYFEHFIIPAVQGGAGTSINLNINEIIANVSLQKMGKYLGEYEIIDPIETANIFQSTNDVIPTSLTVAAMFLLINLEKSINELRFRIEELENQYRNFLRIGYTQMQEAVPSSYGKLFSTYNEALSRDWWRVSKCLERIKVVNLGGSAIGTSTSVPRFIVMEVTQNLQKITNLPVTRSENLVDATCNLDKFVEVHSILKSNAVNLEKISSDMRLLASDLVNQKEIFIPQRQVGSSIMPAKINPVISEFAISVAHKVYSNDVLISSLSGQGCLELNAYLPVLGSALIESLKLLIAANTSLKKNLFDGITIFSQTAAEKLYKSAAITTILLPYLGYHLSSEIAKEMKNEHLNIFEVNEKLHFLESEKLKKILEPSNILKMGFSINDILE